jgi:benzoyl-CoA reductase/2-hydroxyglutaryl-CoA dehydratase subunit BcrC/BadD/HgdB
VSYTVALATLISAADDPTSVATQARAAGQRVVWTLGADIPRALVDAFGLRPIRLVPAASSDPAIDALIGSETLGRRGRLLLAAIARLPREDALLISHADSEQPQIFATLRELGRLGALDLPPIAFLDLLTTDSDEVRRYNRVRVAQVATWLGELAGRAPDLARALDEDGRLRAALHRALIQRGKRGLSGATAHRLVAAASTLPPESAITLLEQLDNARIGRAAGEPVYLSGSLIEHPTVIELLEANGRLIVDEDHAWGSIRSAALPTLNGDALTMFAEIAVGPRSGPFCDVARRAALAVEGAEKAGASTILFIAAPADEGAPWQAAAHESAARAAGLGFERVDLDRPLVVDRPAPTTTPSRARRSRKSLAAVAEFGAYQRDWFARVRAEVAAGSPFIAVNANAPQETMRALGVPFVVNQWWASIVAAKQQTARYAALLEKHGLPSDVEAYSAQGAAAAFDRDVDLAPWGGLPKPDIVGAVLSTDATASIFEAWANATGARFQRFERSIESRWTIPIDWWDGLADAWDTFIEPERLDLVEAELRRSIVELETLTGRSFDGVAFKRVMDLVNEQEEYYRLTRELVARTVPAPIGVVDSMPATMVPQWHRGTEWARDAARTFYEEVAERVASGEAACPNERFRLMFVGRGVWSDMSFYQRWEESYGAIFVCSMYLSLAADGYIRRHDHGRDPLRALAARFVTMGDELRMPTWAGAWHVKEARLHQVDGAVALSDADPLVLRALRESGVAVLEIGIDNFALDAAADAEIDRLMRGFLEGPVAEAAARRA